MKEERLFHTSGGARPYLLRYGISILPAALTIFGADMHQMLLILGVGVILSGIVQWMLAHYENEDFLSTMWVTSRLKVQTNKRAKTERDRQRQLEARRREAIEKAKREGEAIGIFFGICGVVITIIGAFFV